MPIPPPGPTIEVPETLIVRSYYKPFMDVNPPRFSGGEGQDKVEEWLMEIGKAFNVIYLLE